MAGITTALFGVLGTQALLSGYQIYQGEKARSAAEDSAKKQEEEQNRLIAEAKNKERLDEVAVERDRKRAKQRQDQLAAQSANKGGTLLSGNMNALGSTGAGKSLLGV